MIIFIILAILLFATISVVPLMVESVKDEDQLIILPE